MIFPPCTKSWRSHICIIIFRTVFRINTVLLYRALLHSQLLHPSPILLKNDSWCPLTIFPTDILTMVLTLYVLTSPKWRGLKFNSQLASLSYLPSNFLLSLWILQLLKRRRRRLCCLMSVIHSDPHHDESRILNFLYLAQMPCTCCVRITVYHQNANLLCQRKNSAKPVQYDWL